MHTVAFDFSGLDHLNPGNGQYRYCTDLLRGLARLQAGLTFVVIGSQPKPPPQIAGVFDAPGWRYLHLPRVSARGAYYADLVRYPWLLQRERVDLFHTPHTFIPRAPIPMVVTIMDLMTEMFPEYEARRQSRPYRRFKAAVQRQGTHAIAISETTAEDLRRIWHVRAERISTVPLGVEEPRPSEAVSPELREAARSPFILSPYNLEPRKNLSALIAAMKMVRRSVPDARLVLYGRAAVTPEREARFRDRLRDAALESAVSLTGFVSDEDLAWLYREAALFVFPTLYEGFGIPVVEAMAAGACVVTRNQSAMAEVLGHAGVQVETQDPEALAAAISALLADPQRRATLGRAAKVRAGRFTQEAMSRGTVAAYMRALERR
ncbi:MAG TPA: glycosyltransferase family 1 protein [Vicinamibacterales bacterium]|nr:glycosyltransferase family 1 protein [Vicinamibacterales bacterium]